MDRNGVLLVNLGTPRSPKPWDVHRYLTEFLTDNRVIDLPWLSRQLLVRGLIVPKRFRQSAHSYAQIWTEKGSPLLVHGEQVRKALQNEFGEKISIELAMRYQSPSIKESLHKLFNKGITRLLILPLFPQYASATTGSLHQKVMELISQQNFIPELIFLNHYCSHPGLIRAFAARGREHPLHEYDQILFSFHGLPKRHVAKHNCYLTQCHATAEAIKEALNLDSNRCSLSFQSRLGKDPWLEPFTNDTLLELARSGKKKVLVFCPSFVCDCLETTFEIGIEYAQEFKKAGGERLDLVQGLNDHPEWILALKEIVSQHLDWGAIKSERKEI